MIAAITKNLNRAVKLLHAIENEQYNDASVKPYHSSIGIHIRHILDVFDCVLAGFPDRKIDLTARKRNTEAETDIAAGLEYFHQIIGQLHQLNPSDFKQEVIVVDDLGTGKLATKYTLGAILAQAHSHAIHHFATIGYITAQLNITLPDADFGYNPTTPFKKDISTMR